LGEEVFIKETSETTNPKHSSTESSHESTTANLQEPPLSKPNFVINLQKMPPKSPRKSKFKEHFPAESTKSSTSNKKTQKKHESTVSSDAKVKKTRNKLQKKPRTKGGYTELPSPKVSKNKDKKEKKTGWEIPMVKFGAKRQAME